MKTPQKLLALASGGGHWVELLRVTPAFAGCDVAYVSMHQDYADDVAGHTLYTIPDASRFNPWKLIPIFFRAMAIMRKEKPSVIVTTGSAPMLAFVLIGRLTGCRSLWIDSFANSEHLTTSGRIAKLFASKVIAQWPEVAKQERVDYWGSII